MLRLKRAEIEQSIDIEQARLLRIEARLRQIEQEGKVFEQDVVLKGIDPQKVVSIRDTAATGEFVGQLLGMSIGALQAQGIEVSGPPMTIFHDLEFKPTDLDVEIAIPVPASTRSDLTLEDEHQLILKDLPGIRDAACIVHTGSYDTLQQTYEVVGRWIATNGYRIVGPVREVYLTAPDEQGQAITEIQWPVDRA